MADSTSPRPGDFPVMPFLESQSEDPIRWGEEARMASTQTIVKFLSCRCMQINLAQGVAVLPCVTHQEAVLGVIGA